MKEVQQIKLNVFSDMLTPVPPRSHGAGLPFTSLLGGRGGGEEAALASPGHGSDHGGRLNFSDSEDYSGSEVPALDDRGKAPIVVGARRWCHRRRRRRPHAQRWMRILGRVLL